MDPEYGRTYSESRPKKRRKIGEEMVRSSKKTQVESYPDQTIKSERNQVDDDDDSVYGIKSEQDWLDWASEEADRVAKKEEPVTSDLEDDYEEMSGMSLFINLTLVSLLDFFICTLIVNRS